jgi:RNA polymerase sigma-70 factor (ECF subfamily)
LDNNALGSDALGSDALGSDALGSDASGGNASGSGPLENDRSDDQLVAAAQRGDRAAFSAVIQRHRAAMYGYLHARLLEPADTVELCQEVFLRCCTVQARFDSPAMVRPWLIGIARNLLRERVRLLKGRREVAWTEMCLDLETWNPPDERRHDGAVRLLPACLDSLGPTAREVLDLHYRGNHRLAAIGDRLHRSEGAVKLLMFRARQALRLCLSGKI